VVKEQETENREQGITISQLPQLPTTHFRGVMA
jgi:hypothetical protein